MTTSFSCFTVLDNALRSCSNFESFRQMMDSFNETNFPFTTTEMYPFADKFFKVVSANPNEDLYPYVSKVADLIYTVARTKQISVRGVSDLFVSEDGIGAEDYMEITMDTDNPHFNAGMKSTLRKLVVHPSTEHYGTYRDFVLTQKSSVFDLENARGLITCLTHLTL